MDQFSLFSGFIKLENIEIQRSILNCIADKIQLSDFEVERHSVRFTIRKDGLTTTMLIDNDNIRITSSFKGYARNFYSGVVSIVNPDFADKVVQILEGIIEKSKVVKFYFKAVESLRDNGKDVDKYVKLGKIILEEAKREELL